MNTKEDKEEKEKVQTSPSSGPTPVHLTTNAERDNSEHKATHNTTRAQRQDDQEVDNPKAPHMNKLKPVREVNADKKPWRKAGANISDYFNYGFDEESWSTYCKKQSKLRSANRKMYTNIMVQKGHTRHEQKESCPAHPPSGSPSIPPSRQSSVASDVTYGRPGCSSGLEKCTCHSVKASSTQVVTEISPKKDINTSYHLSTPSNINFLSAYTNPPPFLYRREPPSPHHPAPPPPPPPSRSAPNTLASSQFKGFDDPSLCPCASGESSSVPRNMSYGVFQTAKFWEYLIRQKPCDKDRGRSTKHAHNKHRKRGRDRDRESYSSSHNSAEERMRHRDSMEPGYKRHTFARFSGEKEQYRESRQRDKSEGWQKLSSSSNRSTSNGGENRNSQSRHKHNKAKRNRKDKRTCKMLSTDQGRKLKSD